MSANDDDVGKTGRYPKELLIADDQGKLQFAIGADKQKNVVMLYFETRGMAGVGLPKGRAILLAQALLQKASELKT